jgi:hypothetical protein
MASIINASNGREYLVNFWVLSDMYEGYTKCETEALDETFSEQAMGVVFPRHDHDVAADAVRGLLS